MLTLFGISLSPQIIVLLLQSHKVILPILHVPLKVSVQIRNLFPGKSIVGGTRYAVTLVGGVVEHNPVCFQIENSS